MPEELTAPGSMPCPGRDFDPSEHPPAADDHPLLAAPAQWGLDYAWASATAAQLAALLKANQAQFACRYVNDARPGGKGIMAAEAQALEAAGIIICPCYETTGTDFSGGHAAGVTDGQAAAAALHALGAPAGTYCWFAIDTGTTSFAETNAYLAGAKAGTGAYIAQLYGSYGVVEAAHSAGLGDKHWQTYAWSAGKVSPHAALYQYQNGVSVGGISMDRDRTIQPLSGPWARFAAAPPPAVKSWRSWTVAGQLSLGEFAQQVGGGMMVSTLLRQTATHFGKFDPILAQFLNDAAAGKVSFTAKLPKGCVLWVYA